MLRRQTLKRIVWADHWFLLLISAKAGLSDFLEFIPLRLYNQLDTSGNAQKAFKETFIFSI